MYSVFYVLLQVYEMLKVIEKRIDLHIHVLVNTH